MKRAINFLAALMFAFVIAFGFLVNTASADSARETQEIPTAPNLLATNVKIIELLNTTRSSLNDNSYVIRVSDGTTQSCPGGLIRFPVTGVKDISSYERGFQMALEALKQNLTVNILALQRTGGCNDASLIELLNNSK
jgi:hypothetical protein